MTKIEKILPKYQVNSQYKYRLIEHLEKQNLIKSEAVKKGLMFVHTLFLDRIDEVIRILTKRNNKEFASVYIEKIAVFCASRKLPPTLNEKSVSLLASECAVICNKIIAKSSKKSLQAQIDLLEKELDVLGVSYSKGKTKQAVIARYCCNKWWHRKLRTIHFQDIETLGQISGLVNNKRQKYVTDYTLSRKNKTKKAHKNYFKSLLVVDELDNEEELYKFVKSSLSNPKNRSAELLMRMYGAAKYAQSHQYDAHFITVLCPIEMKSSFESGGINKNFASNSVKTAHGFINQAWRNTRSALDKKTTNYFGFRVVEPCHDGSPHWHILVYSLPKDSDTVISTIKAKLEQCYSFQKKMYACKVDIEGLETEVDRFKAVNYLLKSIVPNSKDDKSIDIKEKIYAWASANRVRQYAQFGLPPAGLMRTARKLADKSNLDVKALWNFSTNGDWLSFVEKIGWSIGQRKKLQTKLHKDYLPGTNKYGDPYGDVVIGLVFNGKAHRAIVKYWQIKRKVII